MSINPYNYNIDYFDSVPFGPITDTDFLNQLLSHNLQNLDPAILNALGLTSLSNAGRGQEYDISQATFNVADLPDVIALSNTPSTYNDFTQPLNDNLDRNPSFNDLALWYPDYATVFLNENDTYKTLYGVPATLSLGFVGNVNTWVQNGITTDSATELVENGKRENKYGPVSLVAYDSTLQQILVKSNTGLIQYNTGVQGDFRDQIFNRTLGVGVVPFSTIGSGINYKPDGENISELDKIARERRGFELKERLRVNVIDDTVGALNLNPISLLMGNPPISFDISITRPANFIGRAAEYIANLGGFNLPISILQDYDFNFSIFNKDGTLTNQANPNNIREIDVTSGLLNRTGLVTRNFIFDNIKNNKYGPNFEEDYETKNEGTYLNLLAEKPLENVTEDQYGGFYGKYETPETVGRSLSEKANFLTGTGNTISEFNDSNKENTTYNGTDTEKKLTPGQTGTVDEKFDWRPRSKVGFTKGILAYTQNLVNKSKRGDAGYYIGYFNSAEAFNGNQTYTQRTDGYGHSTGAKTISEKPTRPSEGNTARNYNFETGSGGEYYCRSWSSRRKYHTWNNLIRKSGNWWRIEEKFKSNMTMNWGNDPVGIPKIAYEKFDSAILTAINAEKKVNNAAIPYMFSIENLAWKDAPQFSSLPECEKGPNGGRIMWFPPYDISFSENNSVNWEPVSFIGRGENIYTYNNTERSGTLDFTVIVDHPAALNALRDKVKSTLNDEPFHSFFAGCDIDTLRNFLNLPNNTVTTTEPNTNIETSSKTQPSKIEQPPYNNIKIYFENSKTVNTTIGREVDLLEYEVDRPNIAPEGVNFDTWTNNGSLYTCGPASGNNYTYLNLGTKDKIDELVIFLLSESGKNYKIKIEAYTSPDNPTSTYNKDLAEARAKNTKEYLYNKLLEAETVIDPPRLYGNPTYPQYKTETELINSSERWSVKGVPNENSQNLTGNVAYGNPCDSNLNENDPNSKKSKEARYSIIILEQNLTEQNNLLQTIEKDVKKEATQNVTNERGNTINEFANNFINECDYFEAMKREQPFVYNSLQEKIKYFHPAFHSMTPEGLNSRLTFLNQCTRQGPQIINQDTPQNMVFGRPPICVLRIGDFYNTKIVVDSINITYDPLQWDLNPEGIGVQPMLAKISMSFKFVGGSSLGGPISQLQNAVSYNFYANTGVYQPWTYVESEINKKQKFIYGAFLSPEDAATAYGNVNTNIGKVETEATKQNTQSVNTTTTTNAPISTTATTQIEEAYSIIGTTNEFRNNVGANSSDNLFDIIVTYNEAGTLFYGGELTDEGIEKGYKITSTMIQIVFSKPDSNFIKTPNTFNFTFTPDLTDTDKLATLGLPAVLDFIDEKQPSNPNDGFEVYVKNIIKNDENEKAYRTFFYRQTGSLDIEEDSPAIGGS